MEVVTNISFFFSFVILVKLDRPPKDKKPPVKKKKELQTKPGEQKEMPQSSDEEKDTRNIKPKQTNGKELILNLSPIKESTPDVQIKESTPDVPMKESTPDIPAKEERNNQHH